MKFNAAFFTSLFHFSRTRSTTHSKPVFRSTGMLHQHLAEVFDNTPWSRIFARLTKFNASGLKVVIEQGLFIAIAIGVVALLIFNGALWLNPEWRESIIVRHYTEQPQTSSSPGYNQSSGQSSSVSFSQRLYTP